ncbi:TolB family protein [Desulforamulus putei]|uniref:TolB protein n=1 Tax=Desulforamulus putei DSM 12395 TaxID=1121429 RepID=A0A1M4VW98_9FIRM|nr:PD40 domain-containing protein [Desulforamulus putei]SHE73246.1 TolB protein [Desulforamulus putei DSM 12395]
MSEERFNDQENKVLPIEAYLKAREEGEDGISQLLNHMRQVREAVPVNRRLQVELRKKLLERQKELRSRNNQANFQAAPTRDEQKLTNKWRPWLTPFLGVAAVILVLFAVTGLWRYTNGVVHLEAAGSPQELTRFWTEAMPLQPAVSPDGSKILVVRGGGLVLLSETGVQLAYLAPPEGAAFRSPSWSPDGRQVSFVLSTESTEEIKQIPAEELLSSAKSKTLTFQQAGPAAKEEKGLTMADGQRAGDGGDQRMSARGKTKYYSHLVYAPDGKGLAYVVSSMGKTSEVWIRFPNGEDRRITEGDAPTWSPDGKHLVVQRPGRSGSYELWLVNIETGGADLLGQGENPVWSNNGYLAFCTEKAQERILTFLSNGEPQYSVRQQAAEIRVAYLGKDGAPALKKLKEDVGWLANSHLLVAPENRISGLEINWLRQQELSGSRGPKTLVLNEVQKCEGQVFGPEGKWLLFARRDGDTVALLKLRLEERWEKERD